MQTSRRPAVILSLLLIAGSTFALQPAHGQSGVVIPPNPFCGIGACGFGRDGIPEPYAGRGITRLPVTASAGNDNVLGFPTSNMSFLSWVSGADMTGVPTNANDIWGYTSPAGREYAIVGLKTGTAFVDITDPVAPVVVDVIDGANSDWRDMAVFGEYAYSVNESAGGLQIIDLSAIDEGTVKLVGSVTSGGLRTAHNIQVNGASGYAYLLGSNLARGGLLAADLSDPALPTIEPVAWNAAYVHDIVVRSFTSGPNRGREIVFAFTGPFGLHILDLTDKSDPITVTHFPYRNATYGHSGALSADGKFLYINDELDERLDNDVSLMSTYVVRVRNLSKPRLVRTIEWDLPSIDHNSMVQDGTLYLSSYTGGLRLLDITQAKKPVPTGYFDTHPDEDSARFNGAWGIYAGFPSGNVVVSDIQRGLFVLRAR